MADCLDNIIGLTENDCTCYGDTPVGWEDTNASETGYYITDPKHGFPLLEQLSESIDCGDGDDVFTALSKSRSKAIQVFRTDLGAATKNLFTNRLSYDTQIGRLSYSAFANHSGNVVGIRLRPLPFRYAELVITKAYLGINASESVTVTVKTNADRFVQGDTTFTERTLTFSTTSNKFTSQTEDLESNPIILPMWNKRQTEEELKYFLSYTLPNGAKPLNNTFTCCGKNQKWRKHFAADGFSGDSEGIDALDEQISGSTGAMGLVLEGYVRCKMDSFLCDLESMGDYSVKEVVGRTIQYGAAAILISQVLDSSKLNRFTLESPEELERRKMELESLYADNVSWITHNLPSNAKDCLDCKAGQRFKKMANLI